MIYGVVEIGISSASLVEVRGLTPIIDLPHDYAWIFATFFPILHIHSDLLHRSQCLTWLVEE